MALTEYEKQAILQKAIEDYPIGTVYGQMYHDGTLDTTREYTVLRTPASSINSDREWYIDCGSGYLYVQGKWAPIIKPPTEDNYLTFN